MDEEILFIERGIPAGTALAALPESALINPAESRPQVAALAGAASQNHVAIIAGLAESTKFDKTEGGVAKTRAQLRGGALLFLPDGSAPQRYDKALLVPFGEYRPLQPWMPWPQWLVPDMPEVAPGGTPRVLPGPGELVVGTMICWESLFAEHSRALARGGATILVQLANEGWFGDTAAGAQHNLGARLRAVETGRPVVISSNMGPAAVVDTYGRLLANGRSIDGPLWVTARVSPNRALTPYSRWGDVFVYACVLAALAGFTLSRGGRKS
jgi:apolipoprotein N-acyltransferase